MRIERFEYRDKDSGWHLAPVEFFPDLTLLVGVSGVGKTRILRAIETIKDIAQKDANGRSTRSEDPWGVEWDITFSTREGSRFRWSGEFESRAKPEEGDDVVDMAHLVSAVTEREAGPRVVRETLWKGDDIVVERGEDGILLRGSKLPKLSSYQSVLSILSEEETVRPAYEAFSRILLVDNSWGPAGVSNVRQFDKVSREHDTLHAIREADLETPTKLALLRHVDPALFESITQRFREVFSQVEEVGIQELRASSNVLLYVRIRERGVSGWIPTHKVSSGMMRTLLHIARMFLSPDGTVVLIDEFENSMGVNCIDFVTKEVVHESDRIQFIITSHHPYIINSIDTRHWMIVCRDGSTVSTHRTTDLGLEGSAHESFIKLINLPQFQEGIATG